MPTVSQILNAIRPYLTQANKVNPNTPLYRSQTESGKVYIYKIPKTNPPVLVYTSSGAIDCDGIETDQCNIDTDGAYQDDTSCHTSNDDPFNASIHPFYVLPIAGSRFFDYTKFGISCGQIALVTYGSKMNFGVFADENADPQSTGEISPAMASSLGIDPNPTNGGVDDGVTFIIFTGGANIPSPVESHNSAVTKGNAALTKMLNQISAPTPPSPGKVKVNGVIQQGSGNIEFWKNNVLVKKLSGVQGRCGYALFSKGDVVTIKMYGATGYQFSRWCYAPCSSGGSTSSSFKITIGSSNINLYAYFRVVCSALSMAAPSNVMAGGDELSTNIMQIEQLAAENAIMKICVANHYNCMFCPVGALQAKFGFMQNP